MILVHAPMDAIIACVMIGINAYGFGIVVVFSDGAILLVGSIAAILFLSAILFLFGVATLLLLLLVVGVAVLLFGGVLEVVGGPPAIGHLLLVLYDAEQSINY